MSLKTISFVILLVGWLDLTNGSRESDCNLPSDCSLKPITQNYEGMKTFYYSIICKSQNLDLKLPLLASNVTSKCLISDQQHNNFYFAYKDMLMLKEINLTSIIEYLNSFEKYNSITILKAENGIYISNKEPLDPYSQSNLSKRNYLKQIFLKRTKFTFYSGENKQIRSCQDFIDLNITWPNTIFQLNLYGSHGFIFSTYI